MRRNVRQEIFSAEENLESDLRAALIGEMIKARENAGDPGGLNMS